MIDIELRRNQHAVHRPGPTVGQKHEVARVVSFRDRDLLDRTDHAGDRDANDAVGEHMRLDPAEPRREPVEGGAGKYAVQGEGRCELRLVPEPAEHEVGVRNRRLGPASPVRGGARVGAGAARPDRERLPAVEPCDAAAARSDGDDLHLRRAVRIARDHLLGSERRAEPFDQAHVGARAAHVIGDQIVEPQTLPELDRRGHAPGRTGEHRQHRQTAGALRTHHPAVRGHQEDGAGESVCAEA